MDRRGNSWCIEAPMLSNISLDEVGLMWFVVCAGIFLCNARQPGHTMDVVILSTYLAMLSIFS
uniref:Uncharacterized protein n=1 Tax=Arundo donax TaxID=35708 RepID=A0A0A9F3X4_ARUDO